MSEAIRIAGWDGEQATQPAAKPEASMEGRTLEVKTNLQLRSWPH